MSDVERVLAGLQSADLALDSPPPDVWVGIAAAVAADRTGSVAHPRIAPSSIERPPAAIEYEIDATDVVVATGPEWAAAARQTGAPELETPPTDRTLWDSMGDPETRELWQLIVTRVRSTRQEIAVPLRCDSPSARRWFEMTVTAGPREHVRFRCALVFEDPRPPVACLDADATRSGAAEELRVCGWCGRGSDGGDWLEFEELLQTSRALEADMVPPVTYGVCGDCRDDLALSLQERSGDIAPSR